MTKIILEENKVLVTGGNGFIGRHLCLKLLEQRALVHSVSRTKMEIDNNNFHHWQIDLTNYSQVYALIKKVKPKIVFHLASQVIGSPELKYVLPTFQNNLVSTVNILTACAKTGCNRIIITGSLVEPDQHNQEKWPSTPYAAAKWASSDYARMFHGLFLMPVVIARVFMVYGPAQNDLIKLVPYVISSILNNEVPQINNGKRLIDWVYVNDVVDGFLSIAKANNVEGKTIDLGSGQLISTHDLVMKIISLMNTNIYPKFTELSDRPFEPIRVANVSSSYADIGWNSKVTLEKGLKKTIDWFRLQKVNNY